MATVTVLHMKETLSRAFKGNRKQLLDVLRLLSAVFTSCT